MHKNIFTEVYYICKAQCLYVVFKTRILKSDAPIPM